MRYFIDTEFLEDGKTIDLLSIGIVAGDGREFYAQNARVDTKSANDWVARNVLPHLLHYDMGRRARSCRDHYGETATTILGSRCSAACPWLDRFYLMDGIKRLCDSEQYGPPEFWVYYGAYDWVVLCQLFGDMSRLPQGWPMFAYDLRQWLNHRGLGDVSQPDDMPHNALSDARWIAETYRLHAEPQP